MKKWIFFLVAILFCCKSVFAGSVCSMTPGGNYDNMLNSFVITANTWNGTLLPIVKKIFWGFFAAEFLYQLTFKKILANDASKLYVFFVVRIFTAYVFAQIFLDINFYTGVVQFFTDMGATLGGTKLSATSGAGGMGVTPSGIMSFLDCEFSVLLAVFTAAALIPGLSDFFCMALFALVVLMNLIAIIVTITMLDAYVVLFGGFILTGFSGSSWTQSWWQKYLSYAVATGIRLFVTCLVLGLIVSCFSNLTLSIAHPIDGIFTLLGTLLLSVYLIMTVPSKAASMLSGSSGGGIGDLVAAGSLMMASMGGGAALATAGKSVAGGVANASGAGRTAAINRARDLLSGGANGGNSVSPGNPQQWKSAVKSESAAAGRSAATQSIKDGFKSATDALSSPSGSGNGGKTNKFGKIAETAAKSGGGGHSGAADLNINPHRD